jgi:CRP/FNR family transcriptional regulator, cyclic AMP receptor protein
MAAIAPYSPLRRENIPALPNCNLSENALERLDRAARRIQLAPGQAVFREGISASHLYIVCRGRLKLSFTTRSGRTVVVRIAVPGDFLGLSAVLNRTLQELTAVAMEPTVVKSVRGADFFALQKIDSEISAVAAQMLAREHGDLIARIHHWTMAGSATGRLARLLLDWARANSTEKPRLRLPVGHMTHYEIADLVGTSRETVTRILKRLESDGIISRRCGSFEILDREALELKTG